MLSRFKIPRGKLPRPVSSLLSNGSVSSPLSNGSIVDCDENFSTERGEYPDESEGGEIEAGAEE
jgi:hypothetical protein